MSAETFQPIPVEQFGSLVTLVDPSDLQVGLSPDCQDVEFIPGGVRTRPGLSPAFTALAGSPKVNGLKSYITNNLVQRLLAFTGLGELYKESSPGVLAQIASGLATAAYMASTTLFGREYMAFSDAQVGIDFPRQFDDVNVDRVTQVGPSEGPVVADDVSAGSVAAGVHSVVVWYQTRNGYWTKPSPAVTWTAAGSKKASLTSIPIGPANVTKRLVAFSPSTSTSLFHVPAKMVINDNTTTTLVVDFTDAEVTGATSVDYLVRRIELPYSAGVTSYNRRLFWWGERNKMQGWRNASFDAGFSGTRPLGWTADTNNAGGASDTATVAFGFAYKVTGDGLTATRGAIKQNALTEAWGGAVLIEKNRAYQVRARVRRSTGLLAGTLNIDIFGTAGTAIDTTGLKVTAAQAGTAYAEFQAELTPAQASLSTDLMLRVFADGTPTNLESFYVDEIEIFPSDTPVQSSIVRTSDVNDPEGYDGTTGFMLISENDGQALRAVFQVRGFLYFLKERSLYVTVDDGQNTPNKWTVERVNFKAGSPSVQGADVGEDWAVFISRSGLYYFAGGIPQKISQEIQPTWDAINWQFGHRAWLRVDVEKRRILVGVPSGTATEPNRILQMDYIEGFGDPLEGRGRGRKWVPWFISANAGGIVERSTGISRVFVGNNVANGKIYELLTTQTSDDGVAINGYYRTAFLSATESIGRQLFGYLTITVKGSGSLALSAFIPGDGAGPTLNARVLSSPSLKDIESLLRIRAERVSLKFGTNAVGQSFQLAKLVAWAKPDPWAVVRGTN